MFSNLPDSLRHIIINKVFWSPLNPHPSGWAESQNQATICVSREWRDLLQPLIYDVFYGRWALTCDVHTEMAALPWWSYTDCHEYSDYHNYSDYDHSDSDHDPTDSDYYSDEYGDYGDCIKIDGVRYHNVRFDSSGYIKRLTQ